MAAAARLIGGVNGHLQQDGALTASVTQHAVAAVLSQAPAAAADTAAWEKLLDGASKHAFRSGSVQQVRGMQILAAAMQACTPADLLERCAGWGTQLAEALRRSAPHAQPQDAAAAATPAAAALTQAACVAAAVLFGRLRQHIELPGARREVSSIVPKLLPQLLLVLQDSQLPCSCHVAGLQLLAALLGCVPTAARSAAAALDQALQQRVLQAAASASRQPTMQLQVLAQAAACAALLAAAPGDASSWSDMARRLLSSCHDVLDHLLMGVGGQPLDPKYRSYLAAAEDTQQQQHGAAEGLSNSWLRTLPWQQQQQQQQPAAGSSSRRHAKAARLLLGTCLAALQQLLQQPFAVCVPLPGYSLALLASRLLLADGGAALAAGAVPASSGLFQELLVLQPDLQLAGWRLLQQAVAAAALEPQLQGVLLRLVRQALRAWRLSGPALPPPPTAVRCCMYATTAQLLQLTGLGGVRAVGSEVMGAAVAELYGQQAAAAGASRPDGGSGSAKGPGQQRPAKRAKPSWGGPVPDPPAVSAATAAGAGSGPSALATADSLPAQAAVLRLLQQLLQAGGQLLPPEVRSHIDAIVLHSAQTAAAAALLAQQQPAVADACASASAAGGGGGGMSGCLAGVQVAACQALLASLLVPCSSHRPPFLSQALQLFSQGRASPCPAVSTTCQAAAVQLEALLHPRATPISAVWQHSGMEAVPPLVMPLMWRVVDPAAAGAAAAAAGAGASPQAQLPPAAAAAATAREPPRELPAPAADAPLAVVVMGYPAHPQPGAGQQQLAAQQLAQPLPGSGRAPAGAAAAAQSQLLSNSGVQEKPAAGPAATREQQQAEVQVQQPAWPAAAAAHLPAAPVAAASVAAGQLPEAAAAAAAGGLQSLSALAAVGGAFAGESSDSEGPLPELDSGDGGASSDETD